MMNLMALVPHGADWIYICLIVVLLFGAKKLPELARGLGKSLGEFKKAKQEFESELHASMKEEQKPAATPPPVIPGSIPKSPTADQPGKN